MRATAAPGLEPLMCVYCGRDMDIHSAFPEVWGCAGCRALGWMDASGIYRFRESVFQSVSEKTEGSR